MPTAVDDSLSPSPSPSRVPLLGFLPPTPGALQSSPPPPPSTSPTSLDGEDLAPDSDSAWPHEALSENLDDTPSPGSIPESDADHSSWDHTSAVDVELFTEDELRLLARGGVAAAGEKAHDLFATTPGQQAVDLYKTDEHDQAQIGDPLASIAARRQGLAGKVNPDTKDLLSAMVGLFGYATKQINKRTEARALDAGAGRLAGSPQPMPEPVDL